MLAKGKALAGQSETALAARYAAGRRKPMKPVSGGIVEMPRREMDYCIAVRSTRQTAMTLFDADIDSL